MHLSLSLVSNACISWVNCMQPTELSHFWWISPAKWAFKVQCLRLQHVSRARMGIDFGLEISKKVLWWKKRLGETRVSKLKVKVNFAWNIPYTLACKILHLFSMVFPLHPSIFQIPRWQIMPTFPSKHILKQRSKCPKLNFVYSTTCCQWSPFLPKLRCLC